MPKGTFWFVSADVYYDLRAISRVSSQTNFESLRAVTAVHPRPTNWIPAMTGIPLAPAFLDKHTER
eukprot:3527410-Karenia_brevis.AAC.1